MRRNRWKSLRLVNCGARNKVTFYVFEAVPFSALSVPSSVVVLELSSCCPPLLNNMLEHPKAGSFPNALLTVGCTHQGHGRGKSFPHSWLCTWSASEEHTPLPQTAQQHVLSQGKLEGSWHHRRVGWSSTLLKGWAWELRTEGAGAYRWLLLFSLHGYKTKTLATSENMSVQYL